MNKTHLLAALPYIFACSEDPSTTTTEPTTTVALRVATYNAGLAPLDVDYVQERAPAIADALAVEAGKLDVLCVQEFWQDSDWEALRDAVADELPHAMRLPDEPSDSSCTPAEIDPLKDCALANCAGLSGTDLATCGSDQCSSALNVSGACLDCVIQAVTAGGDITAIENACLGSGDAGAVDATIYGGAYDTGLLTRSAPLEQESFGLDAYLVRSAVHYVKVRSGGENVHVFCAHLGSSIPPFESRGPHGTWEGEHTYQVQQLIDFIAAKAGEHDRVLVLGDLNMGPEVDGLAPEMPDDYEALLDSGLVNPFVDSGSPQCTLCPDNTFRDEASRPKLVDHILVRGFDPAPNVQRLLTAPVSLEGDGGSLTTNLSDHYGLRATSSSSR